MTVKELFDAAENEFLKFDRIENPLHSRPDICAFLMLDRLCPGKTDMVSNAEHDEVWLDVSPPAIENMLTQDIVDDLSRCGVRYDGEYDSFAMFV